MRASLSPRARSRSPSRRPYRFVPQLETLEDRRVLDGHIHDLALLGQLDLGGFNGDVWGHGHYAYVGTIGRNVANRPELCFDTGVKIVDVSDPAHPQWVANAPSPPGTSAEDMMVASIRTRSFRGDLLAVGIQRCVPVGRGAEGGLDLWDVSDPRNPVHLSFFSLGDGIGTGVHELYLFQRGERAYALLAVSNAERRTIEFGEDRGLDFKLVDVTDPRRPVLVSQWGAFTSLGIPFVQQVNGVTRNSFLHSVSANERGTLAFLSYWDTGMVILDIADPANPRFLGRSVYGPKDDGDAHSAIAALGDQFAVVTDEDWSPLFPPGFPGWGAARIYNIADRTNPVQVATVTTPNSLTDRADGFYSVHNPFLVDRTLYLSWYSDGVRVVDLSRPAAPREIAHFVPPAYPDPYDFMLPGLSFTNVWGVWVGGGTILLSDTNYGLYVLQHTRGAGPGDGAAGSGAAGFSADVAAALLGAELRASPFASLMLGAQPPSDPTRVSEPWLASWSAGEGAGSTPLPYEICRVPAKPSANDPLALVFADCEGNPLEDACKS